jgi:hypothetical protein
MNTAVYSPSKYKVGKIYFQRALNWRRNSSPYLSGDAFADLCDFVYKPPRFRSLARQSISLKNADSIFVRGVDFFEFLEEHSSELLNKIVLAGNSDFEFNEKIDAHFLKSNNKFLLQNSFISDAENVYTLPIGIENLRWGLNGRKHLFRNIPWEKREDKILFGPFGNTHPLRNEVARKFRSKEGQWGVIESYVEPKKYAKIASNFRYIACVRGNGIDTHRLWESLYRGSVPILMRDKWSESLLSLEIPMLLVDSWDPNEILDIVKSNKSFQGFDPGKIDPLWMPYWERKVTNLKS